jgi:hypothetical protein
LVDQLAHTITQLVDSLFKWAISQSVVPMDISGIRGLTLYWKRSWKSAETADKEVTVIAEENAINSPSRNGNNAF